MIINIEPYLTFSGNCEEAFNFYATVFQSEIAHLSRYEDMPPQEDIPAIEQSSKNKIMHITLPVGNIMLMGCDNPEGGSGSLNAGNNIALTLNTGTTEEADRVFNELSAGGKITMPIDNTFWGSYFGMLTDRFGIHWMISTENKK